MYGSDGSVEGADRMLEGSVTMIYGCPIGAIPLGGRLRWQLQE